MCVGFESLARWTRNGKPVSPATFIPLAEELGIIEPLGTWMLQQACTTFADWKRRFPASKLDYITVNVSSRQLSTEIPGWSSAPLRSRVGTSDCASRAPKRRDGRPNEAASSRGGVFGAKIYG